jgi:hypothetical protein
MKNTKGLIATDSALLSVGFLTQEEPTVKNPLTVATRSSGVSDKVGFVKSWGLRLLEAFLVPGEGEEVALLTHEVVEIAHVSGVHGLPGQMRFCAAVGPRK